MKKTDLFKYAFIAFALTVFVSCEEDDKNADDYQTYDNHIVLEGEDNLRDLGGFIGEDGKRVLYRKLFRSGELSALTTADQTTLENLGIAQVFDLRSDAEVATQPDALPASIEWLHYALSEDVHGGESDDLSYEEQMALFMQQLATGALTVDQVMASTYVADDFKIDQWKEIFDVLEEGKTSLWHCTAGKDRAGMTTFLVLSSLGVSEEDCVADFMKSNDYLAATIAATTAYYEAQYGATVAAVMAELGGVKQNWIEAFVNDINTNHGGMAAFLDELGVDVAKMQANFLEK